MAIIMTPEAEIGDARRRPDTLVAWAQALRLFSLTASITPVLLGTAMAWRDGFFSPSRLALVLSGAIALHIGTNLTNDYYDHVNGIDSADSMGSSKVIQRGLLTAREVWWGGIMAFAIGAIAGLVLVHLCGLPILAIGLASVAAGYFYTAWPLALGYVALGELTVFIFMGPVIVLGAYYVAALRFAWQPLVGSLPIAFLVAAILHANNVRDIDMDVLNHKLTLANLFGRRAANLEMVSLYAGAYAATVIAVVVGALPWLALATVVTIGAAWNNLRTIVNETAPGKLDRAVLGCAKLHLAFGLVLLGSILLARPFGW
jgi:1,4-dihydroxy-2-naphthoate octaprenyltransferase